MCIGVGGVSSSEFIKRLTLPLGLIAGDFCRDANHKDSTDSAKTLACISFSSSTLTSCSGGAGRGVEVGRRPSPSMLLSVFRTPNGGLDCLRRTKNGAN